MTALMAHGRTPDRDGMCAMSIGKEGLKTPGRSTSQAGRYTPPSWFSMATKTSMVERGYRCVCTTGSNVALIAALISATRLRERQRGPPAPMTPGQSSDRAV